MDVKWRSKEWYKLNYAQKDKYTGFLICGAQIFTPINTDYRKQTQNCLGSEGDQWEGGEAEEDEVVHREHGSKHSASCYGDVPVEASTVYHEHTLELLHSAIILSVRLDFFAPSISSPPVV